MKQDTHINGDKNCEYPCRMTKEECVRVVYWTDDDVDM